MSDPNAMTPALPPEVWNSFPVPDLPRDLGVRLMRTLREQGLVTSADEPIARRNFKGLGLAVGAVLAAGLVLLLLPDGTEQVRIRTHLVSRPTTFRISDRVVAMADPGAVLGSATDEEGQILIRQEAGSVVYRAERTALRVQTPVGRVLVKGTCFRVNVGGSPDPAGSPAGVSDALWVGVFEGTVEVRSGGARLLLHPGESGSVPEAAAVPQAGVTFEPGACPITDALFNASREPLTQALPAAAQGESGQDQDSQPTGARRAADEREPDPLGTLALEGQVLDPSGLPAQAVLVELESKPPRAQTTGSNGTFSFDRLRPRDHWISARREDQVAGPVSHALTNRSDPLVLRLRTGSEIRVRVTSHGGPVAGAEVVLDRGLRRTTLTDADGLARFVGVPGPAITLQVQAAGFSPVRRSIQVPEAAARPVVFEVALETGARLSGLVLDAARQPVEGARVAVDDVNDISSGDGFRSDGVITDDAGHYVFEALAAGRYNIRATHPDHAPGQAGPVQLDGVKPVEGQIVILASAGVLRGLVRNAHAEPVAGAAVSFAPPASSPKRFSGRAGGATYGHAWTDEQGAFELREVPRERIALAAHTADAISDEVEVDLTSRPLVDGLALELRPAGHISGTVVDADGQGVGEASLTVIADPIDGTMERSFIRRRMRSCTTDADGRFSLNGLVEGTYILHASLSAGRVEWGRPDRAVKAHTGDEGVRIVLEADGGLRGRLGFADGSRPPLFEVVLGYGSPVTFESPDGTFEFGTVAPGEVNVTLRGPGFPPRTLNKVKIEPGRITDLGEIVLAKGRSVAGRVLGPDGTPVSGARVVFGGMLIGDGTHLTAQLRGISGPDVNEREAWSGPDGRFEIDGIGNQEGVVAAEQKELGRSRPVTVSRGEQPAEIELVLQPLGSLQGTVRVNGRPTGGCLIQVGAADSTTQRLMTRTGADGHFLLTRVGSGEQSVVASPPLRESSMERRSVTIRPGERVRVDFDITRGEVELEVQVRAAPGARIDAAYSFLLRGRVQPETIEQMRLAARASGSLQTAYCDAGSPCRHPGLVAGDYSVCGFPITGDPNDSRFLEQLHAKMIGMRVYCSPVLVRSSPAQQSVTISVPQMEPLP